MPQTPARTGCTRSSPSDAAASRSHHVANVTLVSTPGGDPALAAAASAHSDENAARDGVDAVAVVLASDRGSSSRLFAA